MKSCGSVLMVTIGAVWDMTCSTCVGWLWVDVASIMVGWCFVNTDDRVVVVVIVGSDVASGSFFGVTFSNDCVRLMLISGIDLCGVPVVPDKSKAWLFPKKSSSEMQDD